MSTMHDAAKHALNLLKTPGLGREEDIITILEYLMSVQPKEKRPYFIAQILGTGKYNYFLVHIPGLDTFKLDNMNNVQEQVEARYPEYSWYQGDYTTEGS